VIMVAGIMGRQTTRARQVLEEFRKVEAEMQVQAILNVLVRDGHTGHQCVSPVRPRGLLTFERQPQCPRPLGLGHTPKGRAVSRLLESTPRPAAQARVSCAEDEVSQG
jgi:hypothetical protein